MVFQRGRRRAEQTVAGARRYLLVIFSKISSRFQRAKGSLPSKEPAGATPLCPTNQATTNSRPTYGLDWNAAAGNSIAAASSPLQGHLFKYIRYKHLIGD